jgi:hypothetical protein
MALRSIRGTLQHHAAAAKDAILFPSPLKGEGK